MKERNRLKDLDADGRIILILIIKTGWDCVDWTCLAEDTEK
jgi:hypothetical protein